MSYILKELQSAWDVDKSIASEERKIVIIRFGTNYNPSCIRMDELLLKVEYEISNFAVIYLVDISKVNEFNEMYELYDPMTIMFFYRGKHMMIDLGTGNNNKIDFVIEDKQDFIDIVENIYRGAIKGKGLVVSTKDFSAKNKY